MRQGPCRVDCAIKRNGVGSVEEKAEDQDGMEQPEHDLLADLTASAPLASASGHE
jgi:hypothetical protein